jgi:hypothetical protein
MWAGISDQESIQTLKFSELPLYGFGERHALARALASMAELFR